MLDKPIVIVDIETTGASSRYGRITEIGMIKTDGQEVLEEYSTLINPGKTIPQNITLLTGIDNAMVQDKPYFDEISEDIYSFFKGCYFMAHYAVFDFSFIKRQLEAEGYDFRPRLLCSVKLSRSLYPEQKSHSLENIIRRHNISTASRHRAYEDTLAVYDFIQIAIKEKGLDAVTKSLKKQLKYKSLPPKLDIKGLDKIDNSIGVYIFKDDKGIPVYIGKSINLRNRVLSHFSQATKNNKEMKITTATADVEIINTDSELEALILESKLVKKFLPIYNRKLRKAKTQTLLKYKLTDDGYKTIYIENGKADEIQDLSEIVGVFNSRREANKTIEILAKKHSLCNKVLGLEKFKGKCFSYSLKKCAGACMNEEGTEIYNLRFDLAFNKFKLKNWPYPGPIKLNVSKSTSLIVDNWNLTHKIDIENDTVDEYDGPLNFDIDNYKIINSYLKANPSRVHFPDSGSFTAETLLKVPGQKS